MRTARILILAALALLVVAACGGGSTATTAGAAATTAAAATSPAASASTPASAGAGGDEAVAIQGFAFNPGELSVTTGTTVTWTNNDDAPHSVKWSESDESDDLGKSDTYERTFDTAGTFDYICGIHPNMTGSVTVTD